MKNIQKIVALLLAALMMVGCTALADYPEKAIEADSCRPRR